MYVWLMLGWLAPTLLLLPERADPGRRRQARAPGLVRAAPQWPEEADGVMSALRWWVVVVVVWGACCTAAPLFVPAGAAGLRVGLGQSQADAGAH